MFDDFGLGRVMDGEATLPIMAWRLDNEKKCNANESLVVVKKIHIERNSFKQIISSVGMDEDRVKERILKIVNDRGKLHNPFTNTGGTIYGIVSEIGKEFNAQLDVNEPIIISTSATMVPLHLDIIKSIDFVFGSMEVEGYCILFNGYYCVKKPKTGITRNIIIGF